jgi:D-alanine-D-alanine ligase
VTDWKGKRVVVLMGGISAEREVSLNTGKGVLAGLTERGHDVVGVDWTEGADICQLLRDARAAVVWIALHGTFGEDGAIQGLLECLKIPYTGSGVLASAVAMDKVLSKRAFEHAGVTTAPWKIVPAGADAEEAAEYADVWGYPVVVKPSREGSSVGVTIVHEQAALGAAITEARKFHGDTLIEKYVPGAEVQVGVLGDGVLGTVEIRPKKEFYDYEAKYLRNDTTYLVPAPLDSNLEEHVRYLALSAHQLLGCTGYSRVDLRIDPQGVAHVLEVNTLPGMTATSLLPKIAKHAGMPYAELCDRILSLAALHT